MSTLYILRERADVSFVEHAPGGCPTPGELLPR